MTEHEALYGIDELAERAGISRRTVRFYVQRGLMHAPRGLGRGRHYGEAHLQRLLRIRALQEEGLPLALIAGQLERDTGAAVPDAGTEPRAHAGHGRARVGDVGGNETEDHAATPAAALWTHVQIDEDVVLQIRGRALDVRQRRALANAIRTILERST